MIEKNKKIKVLNSEQIHDICTSNLSYDDKLKEIQEQKDKLLQLAQYIKDAENELKNGGYIEEMNESKKINMAKSAFWGVFGVIDTNMFVDYANRYFDGSYEKFMSWLSAFASVSALYLLIQNLKEWRNYNKSISYQRRLK